MSGVFSFFLYVFYSTCRLRVQHAHLSYNAELITLEELDTILKRFKRGKSPGPDQITTDALKDLRDCNRQALVDLLNTWWVQGELPQTLTRANVVSLYKKDDP